VSRSHIPAALRAQVRKDSQARCGYCHSPEAFLGMPLDVDHLIPEAAGGRTVRENLWLACSRCNDFKGSRVEADDPLTGERVPLFHPRTQRWNAHFEWSTEGIHILAKTAIGRATVEHLRLNNEFTLIARRLWVEAGRWPPMDDL
jgi:hypothetical protein